MVVGVAFAKGSTVSPNRRFQALAVVFSVCLLSGCVVYGIDDRADIYENSDPRVLDNASASGALIEKSALVAGKRGYRIAPGVRNLREKFALCRSESYLTQPTAAFCSGTLVAPDTFVTAGHCLADLTVDDAYVVFDYEFAKKRQRTIRPRQVYEIAAVEYRLDDTHDWGIVTLAAPVSDRTPAKVQTSGKIADGQKLYVVGHPSGLPKKIAGLKRGRKGADAVVLTNSEIAYFSANLDTFGGNSGSGVFNTYTHVQEGVLVSGAEDYVAAEGKSCARVNSCTQSGAACRSDAALAEDEEPGGAEIVLRIVEVPIAEGMSEQ